MNTIDIILLVCLFPGVVQGIRKGFISQVISIISVVIGIWASFKFSEIVSTWLSQFLTVSPAMMNIISFIVIFLAVAVALRFVEKAISGIIKFVMLGWADKLLGVGFALLKYLILVSVVVMIFSAANVDGAIVKKEILEESVLYEPIKDFGYTVFPFFKELLFKQ
ncbi:MAG: CvpA family protein [Bacteroidales bacterium]|nr:CvpA family protein [Bacteroidales bacterium]